MEALPVEGSVVKKMDTTFTKMTQRTQRNECVLSSLKCLPVNCVGAL